MLIPFLLLLAIQKRENAMRIRNKKRKLTKRYRMVPIGRDAETGEVIELRVLVPRMGQFDRLNVSLEACRQKAPLKHDPKIDAHGMKVMVDGNLVFEEDFYDLDWLLHCKDLERAKDTALILEICRGELESELDPEKFENYLAYCIALRDEFEKDLELDVGRRRALLSAFEEMTETAVEFDEETETETARRALTGDSMIRKPGVDPGNPEG